MSDWARMKWVVAWTLKYKKIHISKIRHQPSDFTAEVLSPSDFDMSLLEYAQEKRLSIYISSKS